MKIDNFPYIKAMQINDCFVVQNTKIIVSENDDDFRHLVLTGKNGSGKTSILREIDIYFNEIYQEKTVEERFNSFNFSNLSENYTINFDDEPTLPKVVLDLFGDSFGCDLIRKHKTIFYHFKPIRQIDVQNVSTPIKETDLISNSETKGYSYFFKHYLVNKKLLQANFISQNNKPSSDEINVFFEWFENVLRKIFEDNGLKLEFIFEDYDFQITHSDGRKIGFHQLSSGFSAFLNIITELVIRVDLIRKNVKDNTYNPPGIVLIDEPENHAHLAMQEQVMPMLIKLFPNLQFIVATHSPAVIASMENTTVFDLTTKKRYTDADGFVSSSYSQLMIKLFGLKNQFSNIADELIEKANALYLKNDKQGMKIFLEQNASKLSPSLILEIESAISLLDE